jgi:hypothetical protein
MKIVWPRRLPPPWGNGSWAMCVGSVTFGICCGVTAPHPFWEAKRDSYSRWWLLKLPFHARLNVTHWYGSKARPA